MTASPSVCAAAVLPVSGWIYSRAAIQQQSRLSLRFCSSSPARRRFPYGGLILVQPSSSGRVSLSPSVCAEVRPITFRQPSSRSCAFLSFFVCAEAVPVTFQQPSSSGRVSLSLSLCLCRGSTGYLPAAIQQRPRLSLPRSVQR